MHALDLLSDPQFGDRETVRALAILAAELRRLCPELPPPFVAPWSDDPVLVLDDGRRPWLITAAEKDPQAGGGRSVVPRPQRRDLMRLAALNLPVQRVAVAHELDSTSLVAELMPLLRKGPRTCTQEVARALVGDVPAHPGLTRAVGLIERVIGRAGGVVASLEVQLDPVILAVASPTPPLHGQPCVFQPVAAWRW